MKVLVLVEAPYKLEKFRKILNKRRDGNTYIVQASGGHILELNHEKTLGVDIENEYKPDYVERKDKRHIIANLRKMYKDCSEVWIASDLDLEGEFIGYSFCRILNLKVQTTPRLIFNELTDDGLDRAIKKLQLLDFNRLDAQKCRRIMDRLIGFKISAAASTVNDKLTVGRVQTIMVKVIIDREKEMEKFKKSFAFGTTAKFLQKIGARLNKNFTDLDDMRKFIEDCVKSEFKVKSKTERMIKKNPPPPLQTSTLQSLVSQRLSVTPKRVMDIAQNLYQKGVISYPRTDCPRLPKEKMEKCETYIKDKYGEKYHQAREYQAKDESAQEAHACIYPTNLQVEELPEKEEDGYEWSFQARKVYRLIWLYTMSSQMSPSETRNTKIMISISERPDNEKFVADHSQLVFEGYLKVWGRIASETRDEDESSENTADNDEQNSEILELKEGDVLKMAELNSAQKASQGPTPYTESMFMKQMKKIGVGRPATSAKILSDIISKEFVYKADKSGEKTKIVTFKWKNDNNNKNNNDNKNNNNNKNKNKNNQDIIQGEREITLNSYRGRLYSSDLGRAINDFVDQYFPEVFNYNFTRDLEDKMKHIESGRQRWVEVVDKLYKGFEPKLAQFPRYRTRKDGPNPAWKPKRELGEHEDKKVFVYLAKYGPVIQLGEDDDSHKRYIKLPKEYNLEEVTYQEVLPLLGFPYDLGKLNDGRRVVLRKSKYGLYVTADDKSYNVSEDLFDENKFVKTDPWETQINLLDFEKVKEKIAETDRPKDILREVDGIQIVDGKWGPYFRYRNVIVGIPKCHNYELVTFEDLMEFHRNKMVKRRGGPNKKLKVNFKKK